MKNIISTILFLFVSIAAFPQQTLRQKLDSIVQVRRLKADSIITRADSAIKANRVGERLDSLIDAKQAKSNFDTDYISRPKEKWTLKARGNLFGAHIGTKLHDDGVKSITSLTADMKTTISFAASYRGITLGLGVNPAKLFKKNSDYELNFNQYGPRFGFDVTLLSANSYKGTTRVGDNEFNVPKGLVHQRAFTTSVYYSFNHRRFSYAAAFSQSYDQLRSAGSLLAGISFLAMRTKGDANEDIGMQKFRIYMGHVGIGAGYAYNYVIDRRWLIHASFLPTVVVINRSNITINGEKEKMPYYFPSLFNTGHFAVIHYFKNYFAGVTAVVNASIIGRSDHQQMTYVKWRARTVFGIRF